MANIYKFKINGESLFTIAKDELTAKATVNISLGTRVSGQNKTEVDSCFLDKNNFILTKLENNKDYTLIGSIYDEKQKLLRINNKKYIVSEDAMTREIDGQLI